MKSFSRSVGNHNKRTDKTQFKIWVEDEMNVFSCSTWTTVWPYDRKIFSMLAKMNVGGCCFPRWGNVCISKMNSISPSPRLHISIPIHKLALQLYHSHQNWNEAIVSIQISSVSSANQINNLLKMSFWYIWKCK